MKILFPIKFSSIISVLSGFEKALHVLRLFCINFCRLEVIYKSISPTNIRFDPVGVFFLRIFGISEGKKKCDGRTNDWSVV